MKLFTRNKKQSKEAARQLTVWQRQAFAYPAPAPGALPYATYEGMERDSMVQTVLTVKRLGVVAAKYSVTGSNPQRVRFVEEAFERMEGSPLTVVGQATGGLMTTPTAAQVEAARTSRMTIAGAHTVGAPDGGAGLPIAGWSREHGDLRVPHFIGLHAVQVLPAAFWLIAPVGSAVRRRRALFV